MTMTDTPTTPVTRQETPSPLSSTTLSGSVSSTPTRAIRFSASAVAPQSTFQNIVNAGSQRKPIVRADPSLFTCFDPKDKELYDLWVPSEY